jgi:hypothetical protein
MADLEMCLRRAGSGICEMPLGHDGEHEYAPAPPGGKPISEGLPEPGEGARSIPLAALKQALGDEPDPVEPADPEGFVTLREGDVDALVALAFGSMAITDLHSEDLALLARVKRARE